MSKRRLSVALGLTWALVVIDAAPATAQDPVGCSGNGFKAQLRKDRTVVRDGETINYLVAIANDVPGACTVSAVDVRLQLPSAEGAPSTVFETVPAPPVWIAPAPETLYGPYPYTVDFGAAPPARYTARLSTVGGEVHDTPPPFSPLNVDHRLQTLTVEPSLTIGTVASTTGGVAPQTVTYTYTVKNTTTPLGLPDQFAALSDVIPTADRCEPLTRIGGDTNGDELLTVSETWTYTCSSTFNTAGTYVNTADVCGDNTVDLIVQTSCSPPDTSTVVVTAPSSTPTPTPTPDSTPSPVEAVAIMPPVATPTPPRPVATPGPPLSAALTFDFTRATRTSTKLTSLVLSKIPAGSTVVITCKGTGCDKRLLGTGVIKRNVTGTLNLKAYIKRKLGVGATITVTISRAGNTSVTKTLTIRSKKAPLKKTS